MKNIPKHVGLIMDGNRRWAAIRGLSPIKGHNHGAKNLKKIVESSVDLGIRELSIFAFSTENWNRLKKETTAIFKLFERYLSSEIADLKKNNVKLKVVGIFDEKHPNLLKLIDNAQEITKENTGLKLNVAINYGGKSDVLHAAKKIAFQVINNKLDINKINEEVFYNNLITNQISDIDFLIRTSGEQRISNFMIWQLVYSELYFTETFWPDFDETEFFKAIETYSKRDRRFGASNVI